MNACETSGLETAVCQVAGSELVSSRASPVIMVSCMCCRPTETQITHTDRQTHTHTHTKPTPHHTTNTHQTTPHQTTHHTHTHHTTPHTHTTQAHHTHWCTTPHTHTHTHHTKHTHHTTHTHKGKILHNSYLSCLAIRHFHFRVKQKRNFEVLILYFSIDFLHNPPTLQ